MDKAEARLQAETEIRQAYTAAMEIGGLCFAPSKCFQCGTNLLDRWVAGEHVSPTGCVVCNRSFVD